MGGGEHARRGVKGDKVGEETPVGEGQVEEAVEWEGVGKIEEGKEIVSGISWGEFQVETGSGADAGADMRVECEDTGVEKKSERLEKVGERTLCLGRGGERGRGCGDGKKDSQRLSTMASISF